MVAISDQISIFLPVGKLHVVDFLNLVSFSLG